MTAVANKTIRVIGAGLAGCEAAWQAANRGADVELWEMKPQKFTPAQHSPLFAELVCSNSLKADRPETASGMLKAEMRRFSSIIMKAADESAVPAGGALAVDRDQFSTKITEAVENHPHITVKQGEVLNVPSEGVCVIATGPLTSDGLAAAIAALCGEDGLHFFDAAAPIVEADSVDMSKAFLASRYGRGGGDYINCPMTQEEYDAFYEALVSAETAEVHGFEEKSAAVFEGCMPVEAMAARGRQTLSFGPLKPVGLRDPKTGKVPFAVAQLRRDDAAGSLYNLVGFQTHLKFGEQKRVFSMIPGLENAVFARYGVMHRNTYLNSPDLLDRFYRFRKDPRVFFAGQMTGVEGYLESACSGMLAGLNAARSAAGEEPADFSALTICGALARYISSGDGKTFQPMNANFGLLPPLGERVKDKKEKYRRLYARGMEEIEKTAAALGK